MNTLEFGIEGVLLSRGQGAAINGVVFYEGIHIRDLLLLVSNKMVDLFFRVVSNMAIEFWEQTKELMKYFDTTSLCKVCGQTPGIRLILYKIPAKLSIS